MKILITLLAILLSISLTVVNGQDNQYLSFDEGLQGFATGNTLPVGSASVQGAENVDLEYQFPGALISQVEVDGDIYDFLHIKGFSKMIQVGAPALPAHNEIIAMPVGANGNIEILETQYYEYDGFMIHPALEPARDTEGAPEPEFQKDENIYNSDEFFPKDIVSITDILLSRETPLALTQVRPVQFNPVTGIIRVYTQIRFRINFIGGQESFNSISTANSLFYTNLLKRNVINSEVIPDGIPYGESSSRSVAKNYIIITHDEYMAQANELANWKRQLGYTVEVVSKSSWTASEVKDSIHNRYNDWTPKPDYFLILGDHSGSYAVPGEILYTSDNPPEPFASDLYFACMDGTGDWVPDMAHGRIAVSSAVEAQVVVDKIIDYEKNPVSDASFYQNGLNCAQYQDDNFNGYADRRFCHTSEDIRDYLQNNQGYTSERVYFTNTTADVTTLRYNNGSYSSGQLLPAELRSLSFNWNGGSTDITNSINAGKFYVFHRDHGYVGGSGWAHPYYTTTTMTNLTNGDKLPVVFSINCHTGEFQLNNCFAEKFLRMSGKGAVGVVAAAYYSYSGYNDALSVGMVDAIWSDPGLYPLFGWGSGYYTIGAGNDIYTMGDVVNQGLYAMVQNWGNSRYQHELFHWFGDPAMKIWTANPNDSLIAATHDSTIDCSLTSFSITGSTAGATATLVYKDELIGLAILDASGNGSITYSITSPGTTVTLSISKLHHKPYDSVLNITGACPFPPILSTNAATGITTCSAFGNGEISNDWGSPVIESGIVFSENPNPEIGGSGCTKAQTSPLVTTGTFSVELLPLSSLTTYYFRAYAINAHGTGYGQDTSFTTLSGPVILPWTEDWEDAGVTTTFTADESQINGVREWSYDMVNEGGRLRFEAGSGFYHGGSKAATLDRNPNGTYNTNYLIVKLDLDNYASSTSLTLSFYYMHHSEESHTNDKAWVRGSDTNVWVEIYDLWAHRGVAGNWNAVNFLDIDSALASVSPAQVLSSTFQVRFGQEDNFPATSTTASDGFTFDDIVIDGDVPGLWIGTSSGNWSSAANWSDGNIPDETDDVIIPEGLSNYPVVNDDLYINSATGNCRCNSLTIQNGAQLTVSQGYQVIVNGHVTIEPGGVLHTGN